MRFDGAFSSVCHSSKTGQTFFMYEFKEQLKANSVPKKASHWTTKRLPVCFIQLLIGMT